jgi:hypothetical protein
MIAVVCAAVITVLNGLAFMPLCFAMLLVLLFMLGAPGVTAGGAILIIWTVAAWLTSCANIVIGLRTMDQPTGPRLAWLYGSSVLAILLYPGTLMMLFS